MRSLCDATKLLRSCRNRQFDDDNYRTGDFGIGSRLAATDRDRSHDGLLRLPISLANAAWACPASPLLAPLSLKCSRPSPNRLLLRILYSSSVAPPYSTISSSVLLARHVRNGTASGPTG